MASARRKGPLTRTQALASYLDATLVPDLRQRAAEAPLAATLDARWEHERATRRTAAPRPEWLDQTLTQVAVAWVLSAVFVRVLEDRGLLAQRRLAGGDAAEGERLFYEIFPALGPRDDLLTVFQEVAHAPVARALLGPEANPAWRLQPSHEAVRALLALLRDGDAQGTLTLRFDDPDTRFLGDLYQDLSADVRERYALLQTPDFVESFLLDRTLEPAVAAHGLEGLRVIDPTCGSGHFLLGAFARLASRLAAAHPSRETRAVAEEALAMVYGSDVNPYAVAIARFRLLLAFLTRCGVTRLAEAPALPSLTANVVVADSLLRGAAVSRSLAELVPAEARGQWGPQPFDFVDHPAADRVFGQRYHAVVGNPPYITCKDAALRELYRAGYPDSAQRLFALAAPFTERFFTLAEKDGFVGLINANSFMKRDFGKGLVEKMLPRVELTEVIDASGAFIPGHGTPTVILFGRQRSPTPGTTVRVVMGRRGEPETPSDPAKGKVWSSLVAHLGEVGYEDAFITVADVPRETLAKHPWSLGGGGASELKELIEERCGRRLESLAESIGISSVTGEDDLYVMPRATMNRLGITHCRTLVIGEPIRDWGLGECDECVFPYNERLELLPLDAIPTEARFLWTARSIIRLRRRFGVPMLQRGAVWYELQELYRDKLKTPLTITFAFVATHNHFVLDRGGKVFNRTAPIIKLPAAATEDEHIALLAWLNSSAACLWLKQVSMNKGGSGVGRGVQDEDWEQRWEFDGTKLRAIPVAFTATATVLARTLDTLAREREALMPRAALARYDAARDGRVKPYLATARAQADALLARMVSLQEELDWRWYEHLGLLTDDERARHAAARDAAYADPLAPPPILAGHRAFERAMQGSGETTAWFERNGYARPTDEAMAAYPAAWRALVATREAITATNRSLGLIERPEHKRRWTLRDFGAEAREAAAALLLDRVEAVVRGGDEAIDAPTLLATLLDDATAHELAAVCFPDEVDPMNAVQSLLVEESVPYLAAQRHTAEGLAKRARWEHTWAQQRREDAGEAVGEVPVPPKYEREDYRDARHWSLRGKLDVARERFIAYPGAELTARSPLFGWAGWDPLQRARALAALYQRRKGEDGWDRDRLRPLLAGLHEQLPWLRQWHNAPDPALDGLRQADVWAEFMEGERAALGWSEDDLRAWRPAATARGRKAKGG
jgi:hypothetical protein